MNLSNLFFALSLSVSASSAQEVAPNKPYDMTVWADVVYDQEGNPTQIVFPDKDQYPEQFIKNLQMILAVRKIEPRRENDQPAIFETGVSMNLTIDPSKPGSEVKINKIEEAPRTVHMSMTRFPGDLFMAAWSGEVRVKCIIGLDGACVRMEVLNAKGLPKSARKFGLDSMKGWRFLPQKLNGRLIESEIVIPFGLKSWTVNDPKPVDRLPRRP